jgi:hypothetical protein
VKIVGIADSDSYLKWGASVLDSMPDTWDKQLSLLLTPVLPSDEQTRDALVGRQVRDVPILTLDDLTATIAESEPDVVLLALAGPAVRIIVRAIVAKVANRPVFISGMPGISFPATRRALLFRSQVDMLIVHSKRERADFERVAGQLAIEQRFGLATLGFLVAEKRRIPVGGVSLPETPALRVADGDAVVFAAQAKVPESRADRLLMLRWIARAAEAHPEYRFVVKLRARSGERQTHAERFPYDVLAAELEGIPGNMTFETGSMSGQLDDAAALVTISSTAALESAARGIPTLVLGDFGVDTAHINLVFLGSGLIGTSEDLITACFGLARYDWLDLNYFHPATENDWLAMVEALADERRVGRLPLRVEARRTRGGSLGRAWDRKKVLGRLDRSFSGSLALVVGVPARALYRSTRSVRRGLLRPGRMPADD